MNYLPGKFVWFEHLSNDVAKSRAFYEQLFGWKTEAMPMGAESYLMIKNGADSIAGYRSAPAGVPNNWTSYLSVPDVDAAAREVEKAGGKVLMPPMDFGPVGRAAAVADPAGAAFCLWKGAQGDPADVQKPAPGNFYWNECWTSDDEAALAFYAKAFGYSQDSMDMGPQGIYYILKKDGVPRAGLMKANREGGPKPMWQPYVLVANCDATAAIAKQLGARECVPPTDIPGVGRFSIVLDPVGAMIAFMQAA